MRKAIWADFLWFLLTRRPTLPVVDGLAVGLLLSLVSRNWSPPAIYNFRSRTRSLLFFPIHHWAAFRTALIRTTTLARCAEVRPSVAPAPAGSWSVFWDAIYWWADQAGLRT